MLNRWVSLLAGVTLFLTMCALIQAQTSAQLGQGQAALMPAVSQVPGVPPTSPMSPAPPVLIDLSVPRSSSEPLFKPESLSMLQDASGALTINQVAALPAQSFARFDAKKTYPLNATNALWLHFRVNGPAPTATSGWMFELPKPFVDQVEFYHRNSIGGWNKQQAGDSFAQSSWTLRGLHPRFNLPTLNAGQNDFYVKVSQRIPLRFNVTLKPNEVGSFQHQNAVLAHGMLLGLMLFVSVFAAVLSLVYRNMTYGWYAAYVLLLALGMASYTGVASYWLWPTSSALVGVSHVLFLLLALAAQLQFCRALFLNSASAFSVRLVVFIVSVMMVVTAVGLALAMSFQLEPQVSVILFSVGTGLLLIIAIVVKAAFERIGIARLWLVAYAPVTVALAFTLIEELGVAPLPWLPANAIELAAAFEVLTLLIALHLHIKSNHAFDVRRATLGELDPLTGFLAPMYFPDTLAQLWSNARHTRQDIVVAYIRANINQKDASTASVLSSDEVMQRCVRMLRIVTRPDDTVARISDNLFAILMPQMSTGPHLEARLSRLVALGGMPDNDPQIVMPVDFRIAATTFRSYSGTSAMLHEALNKKLDSLTNNSPKKIEFVRT